MKISVFGFMMALLVIARPCLSGEIIKVYEFDAPQMHQVGEFTLISFDMTKQDGVAGKASLPFYPVKLLLPSGEMAGTISIEFSEPRVLKGSFLLLPAQHPSRISDTVFHPWLIDRQFYALDELYPSDIEPVVTTHFFRGHSIALSAFTPVRYNPQKQELMYYSKVSVSITTIPDPESDDRAGNLRSDPESLRILENLVQNPGEIDAFGSSGNLRTAAYDYLIITANAYINEFDTLAGFYKPRGILTEVQSVEYINANVAGNDLQEKIRNYISGEYQSHGIEYVLLGGDVEIIPYRGFYCTVQSDQVVTEYNIPADLYYSALDGNWNTDGDNMWAEPDEDDLFPELAVGRMTFSDTAELHNMLHKAMLYQAAPVEGELTTPLLAGEYLYGNPLTYGSDYLNLLVGYHADNGYTTEGIPVDHPRDSLFDSDQTWSKTTLMNRINAGRPWVHHVGHANYTYAMRFYNSDITNANFAQANGITHSYPVVYTHGCNCGGFDVNDCIAERMIGIDNFASAFIGNSRYGWFNQGTTDGPSQHLHREFVDALYRDSLYHMGMAHLKSKSETAPFVEISGEFEPGATRWCFYDNNVLGDPLMALWTYEPTSISVSFPPLIPIGEDTLIVNVSSPSGICSAFTCSLFQYDTLVGTNLTNSQGTACIVMCDDLSEGPVSLTVTGYNTLLHVYDIQVSDYWLGWTQEWNDPLNWYTQSVPDSSTCIIIPASPQGNHFPLKNDGRSRQCKAVLVEPGAIISLGDGETFTVTGN